MRAIIALLRPYKSRLIAACIALVFTAGATLMLGKGLQVLVDSDGRHKAALAIIVEEAISSGIEEIAVVAPENYTDRPNIAKLVKLLPLSMLKPLAWCLPYAA